MIERLEISGSESSNTRGKRPPHSGERGCARADEQCLREAVGLHPPAPRKDLLLKILWLRDPRHGPWEDSSDFALETCMKSCSPEVKGLSPLRPFIRGSPTMGQVFG